ncbi:HD family phosphohydrolase [Candidatus Omnitrophota bacterium]
MKTILKRKTVKNINLLPHSAIAIVTCLMLVTIIQWDKGLFKTEFREGDISMRPIYAPYDFSIKGEVNVLSTETARKSATDSILPLYAFDAKAQEKVLDKAVSIIDSAVALGEETDVSGEERESQIREIAASYNVSESLVSSVSELEDKESFFENIKKVLTDIMPMGIISVSERDALKAGGIDSIRIADENTDIESVKSVDEFFTLEDLKQEIEGPVYSLSKNKSERNVLLDFINSILSVNIVFDEEKTEFERRVVSQQVQPIYNIIKVKKNEVILSKGERIGKTQLAKLSGVAESEPSAAKMGGIFAITILVGLFMLLTVLHIEFYEPDLVKGNKELTLFALINVLFILVAKIIVISPWPSNLIPIAVASMLIAILINSRLAIIATCFLSILVGMISGNRLDIAGTSLVGGIIGIFAIRGVRRRSQVITAGLSVGFANMSYLIAIGLATSLDFNTYITESLLGLASGILSAVIVTGILPIFENTFKITTDISLLELSDFNHPLLKEMVIHAPGTYHHSLVVGNLAEAACESIGANSLLARVASYFHDIGKIEKASYYSENQSAGDSTHDKLSPTMSSLIITNHVKNGVELSQKYKLSKKIIDIIRQHHGTGLVFYFFKRALEKIPDEKVGEQSFRYPGPKPQTKEAACVLLADSVEAASRALADPTPSRIKGLVRKVVNNKFIDGQLDECDLTLKDLEKIAQVFTHILTGIFHTRVEYPDEPQQKEKA